MADTGTLRDELAGLPNEPGVYVYRDADETVLYVGKAKSLRKRVLSYFRNPLRDVDGVNAEWTPRARSGSDPKLIELVARIARAEFFVTSGESEALLLEDNLIKRHRPPFNVKMRDDKSYPYIGVSLDEEYPRVYFTREKHKRGRLYFGPFSNASKVRETIKLVERLFPNWPLAPRLDQISKEEYRALIDQAIDLLSGRYRHLSAELEEVMAEAAERRQYERAAILRDRLAAVSQLMERQSASTGTFGTADVLGVAIGQGAANIQVLQVRDGVLQDRQSFYVEPGAAEALDDVLEGFALEYYATAVMIPPLVVVPREVGEFAALEKLLGERRGSKVEIRAPERGEKRKLSELAARNARFALDQDRLSHERARSGRREAATELAQALDLPGPPARIECYDISNLGDAHAVASMVVFHDGVPEKSHYRSFVLRHEFADDFARMREALARRAHHLARGTDETDVSFAARPGLIVIDGGKGQLNAALGGIREAGVGGLSVVSLAKRQEEVFVPGRSDPVLLPESSSGLKLLQSVRDEAHRFAVRHHRRRRSSSMSESALDNIPGVGPARRRLLIDHFTTPDRIFSAGREELEAVPGLPPKVARAIYDYLNRTGDSPGGRVGHTARLTALLGVWDRARPCYLMSAMTRTAP